jgi:hypothetical protein
LEQKIIYSKTKGACVDTIFGKPGQKDKEKQLMRNKVQSANRKKEKDGQQDSPMVRGIQL